LAVGLAGNQAYLNILTLSFPGGEIRGFLATTTAPEPGTFFLAGAVLSGFLIRRRK
jgi:hypothetical protein